MLSDQELSRFSRTLDSLPAPFILRWAAQQFGDKLAATSSFQTQSLPMLHLLSRIEPRIPVLFMDTGYHFPETLRYRDRLAREFGIRVESWRCLMGHEVFKKKHGEMWKTDVSMCCYLNKVEPLERALEGREAWITGIRRDQTMARADTPVISRDRSGRIKICPMVKWTGASTERYIEHHSLPRHPLLHRGYRSIGCWPCTSPVEAHENDRAGRWEGRKSECGLHFDEGGLDAIIRNQK